jgi:hypothetical protein
VIKAKSSLLVWTDNKNVTKTAHHTDFSLDAKDDKVVLYNSGGVMIDYVKFSKQVADRSIKRDVSVEPFKKIENSIPTP